MSDFWLGILASVPIGLGASVAGTYTSRWLDARSDKRSSKRAERDAAYQKLVTDLKTNRSSLYVHLLEKLLRISYLTALLGVLSATSFVTSQAISGTGALGYFGLSTIRTAALFTIIGQTFALIGAIAVMTIAGAAIRMLRDIQRN